MTPVIAVLALVERDGAADDLALAAETAPQDVEMTALVSSANH